MMGNDDGPGISFHDFNGTGASSVVFTEAVLTAAVLGRYGHWTSKLITNQNVIIIIFTSKLVT